MKVYYPLKEISELCRQLGKEKFNKLIQECILIKALEPDKHDIISTLTTRHQINEHIVRKAYNCAFHSFSTFHPFPDDQEGPCDP